MGPVRTELTVGLSRARFARVLDLRSPDVRTLLRVTRHALTRDDYRATHALATTLFLASITGLLVPARSDKDSRVLCKMLLLCQSAV